MTAKQTKSLGTETADVAGEQEPKVLLYDLETSPNLSWTWQTRETDVIKVVRPRQIISIAWKFLGDSDVKVLSLPSFPGYKKDKHDNKALVAEIYKLFEKADIVVGHNVKRFDDRRSNTDFIKHGFTPPPPHSQVDTLEFARFKFDFNSNRLDDLGAFLGLGRKVKHPGFEMWEQCMEGDPKAWALMESYNRGDVILLEKVYLKMRPWMKNHPVLTPRNRAFFACPYCHSKRIEGRGFRYTKLAKVQRYKCLDRDCGKWSTGRIVNRELRLS